MVEEAKARRMRRRTFLQSAAAAALLGGTSRAEVGKSLLILGGTRFLGRAFAELALAQGYRVSLFHRGQTGLDLFPEAEHILGDRDQPLTALEGRHFDYVVDTSGQLPAQVRASWAALKTSHYTFISTVSVYARHDLAGQDEMAELVPPGNDEYAERKVACERELGPQALILRPCLIIGPHDPTDRFTYWVCRAARWGGDWGPEILSPGSPEDPIQVIDVRDLAQWSLQMSQQKVSGIYNAVGQPTPMGQVLQALQPQARLRWLPAEYLEAQQVVAWKDLPAWVPSQGESAGFVQFSNRKALAQGLTFRPLSQSARDILAWRRCQSQPLAAGLTPERERQLLEAYPS